MIKTTSSPSQTAPSRSTNKVSPESENRSNVEVPVESPANTAPNVDTHGNIHASVVSPSPLQEDNDDDDDCSIPSIPSLPIDPPADEGFDNCTIRSDDSSVPSDLPDLIPRPRDEDSSCSDDDDFDAFGLDTESGPRSSNRSAINRIKEYLRETHDSLREVLRNSDNEVLRQVVRNTLAASSKRLHRGLTGREATADELQSLFSDIDTLLPIQDDQATTPVVPSQAPDPAMPPSTTPTNEEPRVQTPARKVRVQTVTENDSDDDDSSTSTDSDMPSLCQRDDDSSIDNTDSESEHRDQGRQDIHRMDQSLRRLTTPSRRKTPSGGGGSGGGNDDGDSSDSSLSPSASSSSSSDSYSSDSYQIRRKKSAKKRRRTRSAHKIFQEMSKNAERFHLPTLSSHPDPKRRRSAFLHFLELLQSVVNLTKETSKTLRSIVDWRSPKTPAANQALFWLLSANVDRSLRTSLSELYNETNAYDGIQALQLLRGICAAQDEDERHDAYEQFQSLKIEEGETIQHFNKRFNQTALLVFASGKRISTPRKTRQYFRALELHPSSHMIVEIQGWKRKYERGKNVSLAYLQLILQRREERLYPQQPGHSRPRTEPRPNDRRHNENGQDRPEPTYRRNDRRRSTRRPATANRVKSRQQNDREELDSCTDPKVNQVKSSPKGTGCFCCGKDHLLRDCPTATPADRKRIWDERRTRMERRTASANRVSRVAFLNMVKTRPHRKAKRRPAPIAPKPPPYATSTPHQAQRHPEDPTKPFPIKRRPRGQKYKKPQRSGPNPRALFTSTPEQAPPTHTPSTVPLSAPTSKCNSPPEVIRITREQKQKPRSPDPMDISPPRLNMVQARQSKRWKSAEPVTPPVVMYNGLPVIDFGEYVILDSGASDHVTGDRNALHNPEPYHIPVMLANGHIIHCKERGTMRVRVQDPETGEFDIIPLTHTLYVPGVQSHLISISALNEAGSPVNFTLDKATIHINGKAIEIPNPFHRKDVGLPLSFAAALQSAADNDDSTTQEDPRIPARSPEAKEPAEARVSLELMHKRMGHRSVQSIVAAKAAKAWKGVQVSATTDEYCVDCKIAGITKAKRGANPPSQATGPGKVLFLDVIPNPAKGGLTSSTTFKYFLLIICAFSRYFVYLGMNSKGSSAVIDTLEYFAANHKPYSGYTVKSIDEIHGDADAAFMSEELELWGVKNGTTIICAAPNHQEMNGLPEKYWETSRTMSFSMLTHARLGLMFFYEALTYSWQICVVLPAKSTSKKDGDELIATTPFFLYFGKEPNVRRYRVFGCPAICKVYRRRSSDSSILNSKNIVQRGVRGVFVGFPHNQAGWLVFVPSSRHLLTSADVRFDEDFKSVIGLPNRIYHDSLPTNPDPTIHDASEPLAHTGPPITDPPDKDETAPWTPYTALEPEHSADHPIADEEHHTDPYDAEPEIDDAVDREGDPVDNSRPWYTRPTTRSMTAPRRSPRLVDRTALANRIKAVINAISCDDAALLEGVLGEPGSDPSPFLPEPNSVKAILRLPVALRLAWAKCIYKELKGLIVDNKVFALDDPLEEDTIVPLHLVLKAKLDMFGLLEKLKARAVFRGDLYVPDGIIDSWNPHATWVVLKVFLAMCARKGIFPFQIDFIQAYIQAKMRERVFVMIPEQWKAFLPEELHKWCGVPLRLLRALYGYTFSGKFLYEDQADFLEEQGFRQTIFVALWKKTFDDGSFILVLQYSDDFLAAGDNTKHNEAFKRAISKRFKVTISPRADWYLQARIRQDKDGNILLDQQRYSKSIVQRYIPNASSNPTDDELRRYKSPLPADMKWTRDDNSKTKAEVIELETEFGFRYIEAVGSLNYLANTATEELFAIRKACRHMNLPGRRHFKAVLHLLHHLRCHPVNALVFYHDWRQSPVYLMLTVDLGLRIDDGTLLWFTDASHGDCDESRSTGCSLGILQGGVVDMQSFVPQPIPHSTAESETMALSVGAMSSAYIRMGLMDVLFDEPSRPWTVPMMSDSQAAIAMNESDRPSRRSRHIERRWFYARDEAKKRLLALHHVPADYSLADLGTKNLPFDESAYKLSRLEVPVTDHAIGSCAPASPSKRGDGMTVP